MCLYLPLNTSHRTRFLRAAFAASFHRLLRQIPPDFFQKACTMVEIGKGGGLMAQTWQVLHLPPTALQPNPWQPRRFLIRKSWNPWRIPSGATVSYSP